MCAAVGIDMQPRGEQHHVGVRPEDGARRTRRGDPAADGGVKRFMRAGSVR
jgi:hypothetical protein